MNLIVKANPSPTSIVKANIADILGRATRTLLVG